MFIISLPFLHIPSQCFLLAPVGVRVPLPLCVCLSFMSTFTFLVVLLAYAVCHGLPGGGTSLHIGSAAQVAIIPEFTALADATSFTIELWCNSFLNGYEGYVIQMGTPGSTEMYEIQLLEGLCMMYFRVGSAP